MTHTVHSSLARRINFVITTITTTSKCFAGQPDDSDEHSGSKKLRLSEPCDLPSNAPMSADANLSSDDTEVACLLERSEQERVANKSSDPVLSRIAGETSDEQFLDVAGNGKSARR